MHKNKHVIKTKQNLHNVVLTDIGNLLISYPDPGVGNLDLEDAMENVDFRLES